MCNRSLDPNTTRLEYRTKIEGDQIWTEIFLWYEYDEKQILVDRGLSFLDAGKALCGLCDTMKVPYPFPRNDEETKMTEKDLEAAQKRMAVVEPLNGPLEEFPGEPVVEPGLALLQGPEGAPF